MLDQYPLEQWDQPLTPGSWSVRSLVVHITHWNRWGYNKIRQWVKKGEIPQGSPREVDSLNEQIGKAWSFHSLPDVQADFENQFSEMIEFLQGLSEEWFERECTYGEKRVTLKEWFAFFAAHEAHHTQKLRDLNREEKA